MTMKTLIPNPLDSLEQYLRYSHLDLTQLEDDELADEFYALRPLLWRLPSDHWLRERVKMLEHELTKRKWDTKAKPKLTRRVN